MHLTKLFNATLYLLFLVLSSSAFGFIDENRQFQLDSITTNIDKTIKKDLANVHTYLHAQGKNDEERIWLFYGFIATHFKYDHDLKKAKDRPYYSTAYTTKKMSGICIDFACLFKDLCDRSKIPCLVVYGKSPDGFFGFMESIGNFFRRKSNLTNHAWNVVKMDTSWKLMDPTWGGILRVEKKQRYDDKLKQNIPVSIKIVNRKYYAMDPEQMKLDHKPVHPAFFLSPHVPTFKTSLRKEKRRKSYSKNYEFSKMLDSISKDEYPMFSNVYHDGVKHYASMHSLRRLFSREMILPVQKNALPPTIQDYEASLSHVKKLSAYIQKNFNISMSGEVNQYESVVNKKIEKLKRIQQNEQKSRGKIAQAK